MKPAIKSLIVFSLFFCGLTHAADLIIYNAKISTLDEESPQASAVAVSNGIFSAVGHDAEILKLKSDKTKLINGNGMRLIPGINDSHLHVVRGGRFYNLELRWEGIDSLKEALDLLNKQAKRTPKGQWVRVIGGWSPYQFKEKRMPTVEELNAAAPSTPAFVLHLYSGGMLNKAGMEALGINKNSKAPKGSRFERDPNGNPTGVLVADPNPAILYQTINKLPQLTPEQQVNSSIQFYRKLTSLGVTSAVDAGGGGHLFPDNYIATQKLAESGELPLRVSAYLFPQYPGKEFESFSDWMETYEINQNMDRFRTDGYVIEGGGELLVWSASDYENFLSERPELKPHADAELERVVRLHVANKWPFRIHATYDETISRMLNVLERIDKDTSLKKVRWAFDHAETVSTKNLKRIKKLGGGIAIQDRLAFAGEDFLDRYGMEFANRAPPIAEMLSLGIPVGGGTDGTRVSSFNPWIGLYWLVSGKTVGGTRLKSEENTLSRMQALSIYTKGSAWFSGEENKKGMIKTGRYADMAILSDDYFEVNEEKIKDLHSDLTIVNGQIEHASGLFSELAPLVPPPDPAWSPVGSGFSNK